MSECYTHTTNSTTITTMHQMRLCGGKLLIAVTRERCYGASQLDNYALSQGAIPGYIINSVQL